MPNFQQPFVLELRIGFCDSIMADHNLFRERANTGQLISASIECVLLLDPGHRVETITAFRAFAGEIGVLFQIVDDILDVVGSDQDLGKARGSDERLGKRTYVTEFGLEGARRRARESHQSARAALAQAVPSGATALEQITDFIATRTH